MSESRVLLSLVIPAYNEARRIGETLRRADTYLSQQDYSFEIIVVDDGSSDQTATTAKTSLPKIRVISCEPNRGKGFAVREGMLAATGDYRLFYDADGSTPIEELKRVWPLFEEGADIVIGSRSLPESEVQVRQHIVRQTMGRIFNVFVNLLLRETFIDTQCGFKVFTRRAVGIVFPRQQLNRFCFDAELLYIARKHALSIREIPVVWRNSPESRVRILVDSIRMFLDLFKIRINDLKGKYR